MITPNEYMTWEQSVEKYPDHYVVFDSDAKVGRVGHPLEGNVIAVYDNDEIDDFRIECMEKNKEIYYDRTRVKTTTGYFINV